ncbi:MAG: bifunctional tetrahydrofolate synthase/dihydrofolate synthase [Betaproteobacteria bacterium]|nr:bifunctional tetrahydrofolate synthase/dihydrofolate synthase [Betaproteobacteria bacterium]
MRETLADWLNHLESQHPRGVAGIELGLERVQSVSQALGHHQNVPVITVAGTNGKGSTCAMLESILTCAGYRVGLYTSPHLLDYTERVRIGGATITAESLCTSFVRVEECRAGIALTYFEFGTLAAWECFANAGVDVIILEVGLGGRLDAVNIYDTDCAIVTAVDIDHTEYLGETREKIGFEKAGIFRSGKPAICADSDPPQSLVEHARRLGAQLNRIDSDFGYLREAGQWSFWSHQGDKPVQFNDLPLPNIHGVSQLQNASGALAALQALDARLPVRLADIRRGLREVKLAGRFQILPGQPAIVLDVAHNPQAASMLAENLAAQQEAQAFSGVTWAVFGMLRDKDINGVVKALTDQITHWLPCSLDGVRAASADELSRILQGQAIASRRSFNAPAEAFRYARENAGGDDRILVFGSFQTVADVLHELA